MLFDKLEQTCVAKDKAGHGEHTLVLALVETQGTQASVLLDKPMNDFVRFQFDWQTWRLVY